MKHHQQPLSCDRLSQGVYRRTDANIEMRPHQVDYPVDRISDDDVRNNNHCTASVIELINVSVRRRDQNRFLRPGYRSAESGPYCYRSLNIDFQRGHIHALIGDREGGKSLLLETLGGLTPPACGIVRYIAPNIATNQLRLGYMPQHHGFFPELTSEENLRYFGKLYGVQAPVIQRKLHRLLEMIGWTRRHWPAGEFPVLHQSLLTLALSTVHSPDVLLMDEPNFGIDLYLKESIWSQLKSLTVHNGVTIIFTTRSVEDIRFADRAAICRNGDVSLCELNTKLDRTFSPTAKSQPLPSYETIKNHSNELEIDSEKINHYLRFSYEEQNREMPLEEKSLEQKSEKNVTLQLTDKLEPPKKSLPYSESSKSCRSLCCETNDKQSFSYRMCLTLGLILRLMFKNPIFMLIQVILPSLQLLAMNHFGRNPYDIAIAVYNPDRPAVVSRYILNNMDENVLRLVEFNRLEDAIDSVRQHQTWAALEFPANYTNSMINRALQSCDSNTAEFEEEPEAETIAPDDVESSSEASSSTSDNQQLRPRRESELEMIELSTRKPTTNAKNSSTASQGEVEGADVGDDEDEEEEYDQDDDDDNVHDLSDDTDVNDKRSKPINFVTIRLYADNTNLLISGFIKGKVFQALQKAQDDPTLSQFAPKIPPPLDMVQPYIYGAEDAPMLEFLLPGSMVGVVFIVSILFPMRLLMRISREQTFQVIQIGGVHRLMLLGSFVLCQLIPFTIQNGLLLVVLNFVLGHAFAHSLLLTYLILTVQSLIALLFSIFIMQLFTRAKDASVFTIMIISNYFAALMVFGGVFWPIEAYPATLRFLNNFVVPQTIAIETLRFIFSRKWGFENFDNPSNSIIRVGVAVPIAWVLILILLIMVTVKYFKH